MSAMVVMVALPLLALSGSEAADLSRDYLIGRWTTGGAEACGRPGSEITEFRGDGTFTTARDGAAVGVGFWTLTDDQLELQLLAHDALHDALRAVPGDYATFVVKGLIFDVTDQSHRMVTSIGDSLQGSSVARCP
jgi:hypothetical protein